MRNKNYCRMGGGFALHTKFHTTVYLIFSIKMQKSVTMSYFTILEKVILKNPGFDHLSPPSFAENRSAVLRKQTYQLIIIKVTSQGLNSLV